MSLFAPLQTGCLIALAMLLLLAAWQDLRTMHMADAVSLAIVAAFALWASSGLARGTLSLTTVGLALACAAVMFGAGAAAFAAGALGGGDVKLLSACVLLVPPALVPELILSTATAGGLLALLYLALSRLLRDQVSPLPAGIRQPVSMGPRNMLRRVWRAERRRIHRGLSLPYSCAIAAGVLLTLYVPLG